MMLSQLMNTLKDPLKEVATIREGVRPELIESYLNKESFSIADILPRLQIKKSTYYAKKRDKSHLDSSSTEKLFRLISVINIAIKTLGKKEAKNWLYRKIPSLGDQVPMDLLDTEVGHRLVEETLLQIKYGIYS